MKIQNSKNMDPSRFTARGSERPGARESVAPVFRRTLTDLSQEQHRNHMEDLKKGIEEQAERLSKRVCVKEYEKYRRLIREFLDEIVSNGYNFEREDSYAARGRHRFFATVRIIDEKLDELGKEVLKEQSDNIEIMGMIDDIRGLLVDLKF